MEKLVLNLLMLLIWFSQKLLRMFNVLLGIIKLFSWIKLIWVFVVGLDGTFIDF
jgi:hypothetical protein